MNMGLYETIQYNVIKKDGKKEIREYDDILLASTKTAMNASNDSGFSNIFSYISGDNKEKAKISMTTPVVSYKDDQKVVTGFYVPSKYSKNNVPEPSSEKVFIQELKKSLYAVIRFRGYWTEGNYHKHDQILQTYIQENNYRICSQRLIFRYQPPFIPGLFRRNEIAYQVTLSELKSV
jgi:hypothetical protein